jgi:hypothetical protein
MRAWPFAIWAFCAAAGCGNKQSVSLGASIENVELAIEQVALGTVLSGQFDLRLELGAEAPESTSVTLENFALVDATSGSEVLPLSVMAPDTEFPLRVDKGQTQRVRLVIDSRDTSSTDPCGTVLVQGTVSDTLSGGTTTGRSPSLVPSGC